MRNSNVSPTILNKSVKAGGHKIEIKKIKRKVVVPSKPTFSKEITVPEEKPTSNISKLVSFLNVDIPNANLLKFDSQGFTSWTTFERFLADTYDIAVIKELFLYKDQLSIKSKGEKIGYLIVTKEDALANRDGSVRLTKVIQENIRKIIDQELNTINENILALK